MSAGVYNLEIEQGSTYTLQITLKDDQGAARDLTGYQARGQIRKSAQDITKICDLTCTISTPASGIIVITLPASTSSAIQLRGCNYSNTSTFYYDIEIYQSTYVERILNGSAIISPEVTK